MESLLSFPRFGMANRKWVYVAAGVVIVILGLFLVTLPQERSLVQREYTLLEFYPEYYYENFTVTNSDRNAELFLDFEVHYANNYSDNTVLWMLFQLTLEQFEQDFNITEAHESMSGEDSSPDAYWYGWFVGFFSPIREPIPPGSYVIVFWIVADDAATDWSFTLTVSLWTSLLSLS